MGELTPRTVSDMQNPKPTGVVFFGEYKYGPRRAKFTLQSVFSCGGKLCPSATQILITFNQSSDIAGRYVQYLRDLLFINYKV